MLYFLLGVAAGGMLGVFLMCLMQINRGEPDDLLDKEPADFEKSPAAGVDNTVKKA